VMALALALLRFAEEAGVQSRESRVEK
jgi:hypothetical protein